MSEHPNGLYKFGSCLLDSEKKVLWCAEQPVSLPLKAVELLSVLVTKRGEVVTKDEIWKSVWRDSFVEETNLTHNIYLLRKTLKDLGEADLIQTVPRRGYRFSGEVVPLSNGELILERHSFERTLVEELPAEGRAKTQVRSVSVRMIAVAATVMLALLAGGVMIWKTRQDATTASPKFSSIAVLPFTGTDRTEDDAAFGLGIADALITRLGQTNELRIVSTKTASRYVDGEKEPAEAGRELGVDGVLDGTFQKANGRIRVTLRLIRTSDGVQVWSGLISDDETEIFRLQDALAIQTAQALSVNLKTADDPKRPTDNLEAYNQYLKGDYLFRLRGEKNAALSIPFFKEAIRLDPEFARAWAALAAVLAMGIEIPEAEAKLEKALELDRELAEAHATRGFIQMFHHWNWVEAEASLNRAIELDPNSLQAHHWRGVYLSLHGRFEEARIEMERALQLDPVSLNINSDLGQLYYLAGDNENAEEYCKRALSIDPDYGLAHGYLRYIYESQNRPEDAFSHYLQAICWTSTDKPFCTDQTRKQYENGGWRNLAMNGSLKLLAEIREGKISQDRRASVYYELAMAALREGDDSRAIDYLNQAIDVKARFETMNFAFPYLRVHPTFSRLSKHPRFHEILRKVNLG